MVSKITRRNSGRGLIRYCKEGRGPTKGNIHRNCYVTGLHMLPDDVVPFENQMEKFWNLARANHSTQINHLMISAAKYEFDPQDEADVIRFTDYVTRVAENVEKEFSFETQWAIFIQRDGSGGCLHAHCLMNDCTFDGSKGAPHASYNHDIVRKVVDKTLLYYQPEEYRNGYVPEPRKKITPNQMKYAGMSDYEYLAVDDDGEKKYSWKRDLRLRVLGAARHCASWEDFEPELEKRGVGFRIGNNKDGSKFITWELKDTSDFDKSGAKKPMYGLKARGEKLGFTLEYINHFLTRRFGLPSNEEPILNGALIDLQDDAALSIFNETESAKLREATLNNILAAKQENVPIVSPENKTDITFEITPPEIDRPSKQKAKKSKKQVAKSPKKADTGKAEQVLEYSSFDKLEEATAALQRNLDAHVPLSDIYDLKSLDFDYMAENHPNNTKEALELAMESAHKLMRSFYNGTILVAYPNGMPYEQFIEWRKRENESRRRNRDMGLIFTDPMEEIFSKYNPQTNKIGCYVDVMIEQACELYGLPSDVILAASKAGIPADGGPQEIEKQALRYAHSKLKQAYETVILKEYPNAMPYVDFMTWRRNENSKRRKNMKEGVTDEAPLQAVFGKFDPFNREVSYYVDVFLAQAREHYAEIQKIEQEDNAVIDSIKQAFEEEAPKSDRSLGD